MPMGRFDHTEHPWSRAAEHYLRRALSEVIDGEDAIPSVDAALTALRIEAGELPPDDALLEYEGEDGTDGT